MQVKEILVSKLSGYKKNVRLHNKEQIQEFCRALEYFGQTRPFVIDENNVVLIGNGMLLAMQELGWDKAYCLQYNNLSELDKKKLLLSDNKIYALGGDNYINIDEIINDIARSEDFNIPGFDEEAIKTLIKFNNDDMENIIKNADVSNVAIVKNDTQAPQNNTALNTSEINTNYHLSNKLNSIDTQETIQTIICPNCGEVIRI